MTLLISRAGRLHTHFGPAPSGTQVHTQQQRGDPYSILCCLKSVLGEQLQSTNSLRLRGTEVRTPKNIEKMRQEELEKGTEHILQTNYIFPPAQLSATLSLPLSISVSFSGWTVNLVSVTAVEVKRHYLLSKEMVIPSPLLCQ